MERMSSGFGATPFSQTKQVDEKTNSGSLLDSATTLIAWISSSLSTLQISCFIAMVVGCAGLAFTGFMMLLLLGTTRFLAPTNIQISQPLFFDYAGSVAVAVAPMSPVMQQLQPWMCPTSPGSLSAPVTTGKSSGDSSGSIQVPIASEPSTAQLPKGVRTDRDFLLRNRVLEPGQKASVWVDLLLPSDHSDLFQVTAELVSSRGVMLGSSARTWAAAKQFVLERLVKQLMLSPLSLVGLYRHERHVSLHLFDSYLEQLELPLGYVRAQLSGMQDQGPPPVLKASVRVTLKLGLLRRLLYAIKPGMVMSVLLGMVGGGLMFGGGTGAVLLLLMYFLMTSLGTKKVTKDPFDDLVTDKQGAGGYPYAQPVGSAASGGRTWGDGPDEGEDGSYGAAKGDYGGAGGEYEAEGEDKYRPVKRRAPRTGAQ